MLTHELFNAFTYVGAEWVLWLLAALSVISIAVVVERLIFFSRNSAPDTTELLPILARGDFAKARQILEGLHGLEAQVVRAAIDAAANGPESVEEVIAGSIVRFRPPYERFLAFLGTLGNNAPFIGLFGTVIGIIKAFADLSVGVAEGTGAGSSVVMGGISEALVATAVGIFVAIPAVVAFNGYNRWLKTIVARTNALGHAVIAYLKRVEG